MTAASSWQAWIMPSAKEGKCILEDTDIFYEQSKWEP